MEVAPVTFEMFDPLVVQLEAAIVIATVSGLLPPFCSGGSNVTVPVPEQVTLPVATVDALVDELVDDELLVVDVELLGLEEHAASPRDSAKQTRKSLEMRETAPTTIDTGRAPGSFMLQRCTAPTAQARAVGP